MSVGVASGAAAVVPPQVRAEGAAAVQSYRAALGFEQLLLSQLLSDALPDEAGGEAGEGGGEGGGMAGADPRLAALPETVAGAISAAGGLGLASELYTAFEGGR